MTINENFDYAMVAEAASRIEGLVTRTPVLQSETINQMVGGEVFFKCENFQATGAFKQRGAMNAVMSLDDEQCQNGVATHSSGNHGAALAYAAARRGIKAHVVMPRGTPAIKRAAVERHGGIILDCEPGMQGRNNALQQLVDDSGAVIIHPYDDFHVMAGQGTAALEFLDDVPGLDTLVVPVGGGGLISGTAVVVRERLSKARLFGAEPERAADAERAFRTGEVIPIDNPDTIAEGLKATIGQKNLVIIRREVDDIALVSESEIIHAMRVIWEQLKITIEASSAVALAPLLSRRLETGSKTGVILTGGNVDLANLPWNK